MRWNHEASGGEPGGRDFGGFARRATRPIEPNGRGMRGQGHQIFVDELARFAAECGDPRVTSIAERAGAPLRVLVDGRRGVGRATVARALHGAGSGAGISARVRGAGSPAADDACDVLVYVVAEAVKPEDTAAIAAADRPVVAVLNKADLAALSGRGGDEPLVAARARCAELSTRAGVAIIPMIGLLAVAARTDLDRDGHGGCEGSLWAALSALAAHPGGAGLDGSFANFLGADYPSDSPLPAAAREHLLGALDLFGIALGIAAARQGRTAAQAGALFRRISGVDAVLGRIAGAGAEARYQRVLAAAAELEALAVGEADLGERITGFLSRDDTVVARMAAAVDLAEAAGLDPEGPGSPDMNGAGHRDPAAHLPRAVRWQRYSRASSSDLHRACGADIARGSLRLWSQACGSLPGQWA